MARLRAQALLSWSQEARLLHWIGLRDGMSVLEMGCGPGFVARALLDLLPNASLTALDSDPAMLERARGYLGDAAGRVRFVQASALDTGLAPESFDFVIARLLFQHLADPVAAAREALRLLRPGGQLAVIDIDAALWGIASPMDQRLAPIHARAARAQAAEGGDRAIGRRLWRILKQAGFAQPRLEAYVYHSDELGLDAFRPQMDPARIYPAVEARYITAQEYTAVEASTRRFFASPDSFVLMVGLLAHGTRPITG
jgi:ubiquinone/menaquinone biosynthesis C-methylase UbiE